MTIDWVSKLLRVELAACVGGTLPRALWQHFYKARDHWVCKWVRDQPPGFFKNNASYKEKRKLAHAASCRLNKDE